MESLQVGYTSLDVVLPYPSWSDIISGKTCYVRGFRYSTTKTDKGNILTSFEFDLNYLSWGFYTNRFAHFSPYILLNNIETLLEKIQHRTSWHFQNYVLSSGVYDNLMYYYRGDENVIDIHCCQCFFSLTDPCKNRHLWIKVTPSLIEAFKQYLAIRKE